MQRFKLLTGLLVMGAFIFSASAMAASAKIGVFNANYVIAHSKRGQAAQDAIKALVKKKKSPLDKEKKSLESTQKSLKAVSNKKSDSFKKKFTKYRQSLGTFQQHVNKSQKAIQKRKSELFKPIIKDLNKVITKYAQSNGFSLLLNTTNDTVAYAAASYNLNDKLVKALNKYEGE